LKLLEHLHHKGDDLVELYELANQGKEIPEKLQKENENR